MKPIIFEGAGVAIITPFDKEGNINFKAFKKILDFQLANETDAIIVCGTTGESSTMTDDEHLSCISFVVDYCNHAVPVIAGTGSNDTRYATWLSREAEKIGADAVLLVTPYYNKTTQHGLIKHFDSICTSISIPAILYNIPGRTGMNIDIPTMVELAKVPNIVAVKEASGNISYCAKLLNACGDKLSVYSGNDDMTVPIMSLGGKGVISVLSNIMPKETHRMTANCLRENYVEASHFQLNYLDLINALFSEVNPIPIKEAMNAMGFDVGDCRLPLCKMSDEHAFALTNIMWKHGLIS